MNKDFHLFSVNGKNLLATSRGGLYTLSRKDSKVLKSWLEEGSSQSKAGSVLDDFNIIRKLEENSSVKEETPAGRKLKALCLNVSHLCNMTCSYCFAGQGNFGGKDELMNFETAKAAIDLLLKESDTVENLQADFFGGEPLLNFSVVKDTIEYAEKAGGRKKIKFTLTTNAALLNQEFLRFLNEKQVGLILSLDGHPKVHNRFRRFKDGKESYKKVLKNILTAVSSRNNKDYYVRGTFTSLDCRLLKQVEHIADLGIKNISLEPVVTKDESFSITEKLIEPLEKEYIKIAKFYLKRKKEGKNFNFFHFNIDLDNPLCYARRISGCGAAVEYLAVTPDGSLYPCHQFVGRKEFLLGDVSRGVVNSNIVSEFARANIHTKEGCLDCWARYYCSSGCHANAHLFNGSIFSPYDTECRLLKKRLECALMIRAEEK